MSVVEFPTVLRQKLAESIFMHAKIARASLDGLLPHINEMCAITDQSQALEIRNLYATIRGALAGIRKDAERL